MRIGVHAAGLLSRRTGRESYVQSLLAALARVDGENEYHVFVTPSNRRLFERPEPNFRTVEVRLPRMPTRRLWEIAYVRLAPAVRRLDIVHLMESPLPFYQPSKALATVHDVLPLLYPQLFPLKGRIYYRKALTAGAKRLRAVIASSEHTKRDMVDHLRIEPSRIRVIYPAVDARFAPIDDEDAVAAVRRRYNLPERFILYVGTLEPRKNLLRLIAAYHRLRETGLSEALVLAGGRGWLCDDVIDAAKAQEGVHLTGFIADEDLPALYNAASLFVFPSLYEGFGSPPLEAMACGLPVVCSNTSSMPEVVGDAALLVDPEDEGSIAEAMWEAAHDETLRHRMRDAGLARARLFSWDDAARQTLDVYREIIRQPSKVEAKDAA